MAKIKLYYKREKNYHVDGIHISALLSRTVVKHRWGEVYRYWTKSSEGLWRIVRDSPFFIYQDERECVERNK